MDEMKTKANQFDRVSRQWAVQSLLDTCYFELLHVTAGVLKGEWPACTCRIGGAMQRLQDDGLLEVDALQPVRAACSDCRQALDRASGAWAAGDRSVLRSSLGDYRQATRAVRQALRRLSD